MRQPTRRSIVQITDFEIRRWPETNECPQRGSSEVLADGERRSLGAVAHAELVEDVADVGLCGAAAEEERLGDLAVREAPRDETQHLPFTRCQAIRRRSPRP